MKVLEAATDFLWRPLAYYPGSFVYLDSISIFHFLKGQNMYYNQSWAAKGHHQYGGRDRHLRTRSTERAAVNIYRTENSYEILVFAPGRIKEHFELGVNGNELTVSYNPPEGFPRPDWVLREYSRGGFVRSFSLDESIDPTSIKAKYEDGVLQVSLPLVPGKEKAQHVIPVS